jgi:peptidoglycan/LPS O-acetylase OafA/YrhL
MFHQSPLTEVELQQQPEPLPDWISQGRIPLLDGLRGIAVILVLLAHACQTEGFPLRPVLEPLLVHGAVGVELFFVLSGFLITTLLVRETQRTGQVKLGMFFLRRTLRIVPAYFCLLLVVAMMTAAGATSMTATDWAAAATWTVNFHERPAWEIGHAWSLSIEEHFYLVWPFVFACCGARHSVRYAVGCIVFSFLARCGVMMFLPQYSTLAELTTFTRMDTIAFGCLLALAVHEPVWRRQLNRIAGKRMTPAICLGMVVLATAMSAVSSKLGTGLGMSLTGGAVALLIWSLLLRHGSTAVRWLDHPLLCRFGICSYSIYLWQQLFLNPRHNAWWTSFPLNLLLALVAAWVSFRLVEQPFLRLKDRLADPRRPIAVSNAAAKSRGAFSTAG